MKDRPVEAEVSYVDGRTDGQTDGYDKWNNKFSLFCERA